MKRGDKTQTESGPKRPNAIKEFVLPSMSDTFGETLLMFSLVFGMLSIIIKYRVLSWLSVASAVVSMGNMRVADMDFKNLLTSFTIAFMSLLFAPIMFRGNYDNNKPPEPITETETERAERLRLEQVMRDRIEDSRKRKQEEDANRRMFSQPGALLPKASEEPSSQPQQAPTSYRSTQRPSQFKSSADFVDNTMDPEKSPFYKTNQSNDKYVKYHDPSYRDMVWNGPYKRPPHPRQRHRCDYHLEDLLQTVFDKQVPLWDTVKTYFSCLRSKPGEEPPRVRKEVWRL